MERVKKELDRELKEKLVWVSPEKVKENLTYVNLKIIWEKAESYINDILEKQHDRL